MNHTKTAAPRKLESAPEPAGRGAAPYLEALQSLQGAAVPFVLLRDEPRDLEVLRDVDVLIDERELRVAAAALERAGFRHKKTPGLEHKWVFIRYVDGRFYTIDLHGAFIQNGIEYMDAAGALARRTLRGGLPALSNEDLFLHVLLHNLLGKSQLRDKPAHLLRKLRGKNLDPQRMREMTAPYATAGILERALADLNDLVKEPKCWEVLRHAARETLLRHPGNQAGARRYQRAMRHGRKRPVILALLGPDGTGKTTLTNELEAILANSPLNVGRVYMGAWGHDQLPIRFLRRFIPPLVSYQRMLDHVRGRKVTLTAEEKQLLATRKPGAGRLGFAALRYCVKDAIFYGTMVVELGFRYIRCIKRCQRPIVLTDRYVYDLEFRQGRRAFTHGHELRQRIYKLFPAPDGILYLTAPYETVAARKPQLDREQFHAMDQRFREVLQPYSSLELVTGVPSRELAEHFLTRYWEVLLERANLCA